MSNNQLVAYSTEAADLLDLPKGYQRSDEFMSIFSGQSVPEGGHHIAQVYAGHQFGHYVPQLGDGRSIFVGECVNDRGEHWDIHLKGAGNTPYSRMGDGRAVLRSSIREFLASEAMSALGVPTTRALAIIGSSDAVYREKVETGAVVTRLAKSHIRFGNFEYWFHQGKSEQLNKLFDFCLTHLFPQCLSASNPHQAMLLQVVQVTAQLIAHWQAIGFCHGVMNTDNMSILGDTLDYGPYAFMDDYNPHHICNHSDHTGRYAFDQQPSIGLWNLNALAYTFSSHLSVEEIQQTLAQYEPTLIAHYQLLMQQKMGFIQWSNVEQQLLNDYFDIMQRNHSDYSLSFRLLNTLHQGTANQQTVLFELHDNDEQFKQWAQRYKKLTAKQWSNDEARTEQQNKVNPKYILRNHLAEEAIRKAQQGDNSEVHRLQKILARPFDEQIEFEAYAAPAPQWSKNLVITCSS